MLFLLNAGLSMCIGRAYLAHAGQAGPLALFQHASHFLLLNLAVCIALAAVLPFKRALKYAGFAAYGLLQIFLFTDAHVYGLFRFHINSLVWNMIATEGVTDSVMLGKTTLLHFSLKSALILAAEAAFIYAASRYAGLMRGKKARILAIAFVLLAIAADKTVYAFGEMYNIHSITRAERLYPLYPPVRAGRTLSRIFNLQVRAEDELKAPARGGLLQYPKKPLRMGKKDAGKRPPNIIIVVVEGLRHDMLALDIMPNLHKFSMERAAFRRHYSGGNGSRTGVFSLLYGLQGSYWQAFLLERKPPVLIESLVGLGYDFQVLSATRLTFPEFRKTAFAPIQDSIEDALPGGDAVEKDRLIAKKFIEFVSQRKKGSRPFFSFVFFNASHQPYQYPPEFERFGPVAGTEINYMQKINEKNAHLLRNRYKNSLAYNDSLLADMMGALREKGLLENSIVVITGDHGEEFYENGYFGHTSSFDDYQTRVAFVMHMPGYKKIETNRLTSHLDLSPTLIRALGFENDPRDHSQGLLLFDEKSRHPYVFSAGWDRLCIIQQDVKIVFSTETRKNLFEVRRSDDYTPVEEPQRILAARRPLMLDVLEKMSEFYSR